MLRIVHLSDFHFRKDGLVNNDRLIRPLVDDLLKFDSDTAIDIVICSGDLIHRGGEGFDSTQDAFAEFRNSVIEPICDELGLPYTRFVVAPGNHDIDRDKVDPFRESGLTKDLVSTEDVARFLTSCHSEGVERLADFKAFESDLIDPIEHSTSGFGTTVFFEKDGRSIGISALNSSWRCYDDNDKEKLLVGKRQVEEAEASTSECDVKIAVLHHPLDWLAPFDRRDIEPVLKRSFDLLFTGHIHRGTTELRTDMHGDIFVSVAPGALAENVTEDSRDYAVGYRILDYTPAKGLIETYERRFSDRKSKFNTNTDIGDDNGRQTYSLPTSRQIELLSKKEELAQEIQDVHYEEIDSRLLSHGTETSAPETLREMFVMPEIVRRRKEAEGSKDESVEETPYDLSDLLESEEDILLSGVKESGKTTLLYRIMMEAVETVSTNHQIPVYIDYSELGNTKIRTVINQFLHVGSKNVDDVASDLSLLLLVDNIKGREAYKYQFGRLTAFADKFPNTRIIATYDQAYNGDFPWETIEDFSEGGVDFSPLSIKSVKVKQIKGLVKRWFSNSNHVDTPQEVENMVALLGELDIPRTMLAVSIFLWIFEKQEGYRPTNESTMLENFVERLFEKHSVREIYSERFDFRNKEFLLAEMAYGMLKLGSEDYRLTYQQAVDFVSEHMSNAKFDFPPDRTLEGMFEAGILAKDEGFIRFKFNCFFEYYLMKKMTFDESFLEFVLEEENFLKFINEIDYFTGVKRYRDDILRTIIDRLNTAYKSLQDRLSEGGASYDDYLTNAQSWVRSMGADALVRGLKESAPSEEEIEREMDAKLDLSHPTNGIEKKESPQGIIARLGELLNLSAKVLKNSEEINTSGLKSESYRAIIKNALAFTVLYKTFIDVRVESSKKMPPGVKESLKVMSSYAPLVAQTNLHVNIGTKKLELVMREEVEDSLGKSDRSDLEKFFNVFLYSEIEGKGYIKYISRLIKEISNGCIEDSVFVKTISYLWLRSSNRKTDQKYLRLVADIYVKANGEPAHKKDDIIAKYRRKKTMTRAKKSGDQQAMLDL